MYRHLTVCYCESSVELHVKLIHKKFSSVASGRAVCIGLYANLVDEIRRRSLNVFQTYFWHESSLVRAVARYDFVYGRY